MTATLLRWRSVPRLNSHLNPSSTVESSTEKKLMIGLHGSPYTRLENVSDGAQHPGSGRPQHAVPGTLLRADHGETEKHVCRNLRRRRDSNRLPDGRPVQEAAAVRSPFRPPLHVQGEDQRGVCRRLGQCQGDCKVSVWDTNSGVRFSPL